MSYRKIQPSSETSGTSFSTQNQSTSDNTSSDLKGTGSGGGGGKEGGDTSSSSFRRRRPPESLTRNACTNCKKARAKCDGKAPCARCRSRADDAGCLYEVHVKHAKEELVGRINELEKQVKDLRAKNHLTDQILGALAVEEQVPGVVRRLKNDETYDSIVGWLGRKPISDYDSISNHEMEQSPNEASDQDMSGIQTAFRWSTVTSESSVLDHLFQLYFAWVHPVHTLFSEGHFVDSYKHQSYEFCSPALVNATCAMACHLHTASSGDKIDFERLGRKFADASRASISTIDKSLTTVQSFAVLFLVESAGGKCLRASSYLNVASKKLSNISVVEHEGFNQVLRDTVRGIHCLTIEWAQMTFVVPNLPRIPNMDFEYMQENLDSAQWYFYRYINDQCPAWPGLLATVNREKAKLDSIIYDTLQLFYGSANTNIEAHQILRLYIRYREWRKDLPSSIGKIESNSSQALPHVLSLLILYSTSVVQLLRPLLNFEGIPNETVEGIISDHAQEGLFLLDQHYRTQYTCRYQPVLQMFAVLHLCDVIARTYSTQADSHIKDGPGAIRFGIECLMQSRPGFAIAGPLQELLRHTAIECSVRIPMDVDDLMSSSGHPISQTYHMDDFIDACTHPSYVQPVLEIQAKCSANFVADWVAQAPALGFLESEQHARHRATNSEEERGVQNLMQIRNLLNMK